MTIGSIGQYQSIDSILYANRVTFPAPVKVDQPAKIDYEWTPPDYVIDDIAITGINTGQSFKEIIANKMVKDSDKAFLSVQKSINANAAYRDLFQTFQNYGSYNSGSMTIGYNTVGASFDGIA